MKNKQMLEVVTSHGIHQYEIVGHAQSSIVNLAASMLTGEPLRYNKIEERIEYFTENGTWDVYLSDSEILAVQVINY